MTEPRPIRIGSLLALLWLLVVAALAVQQVGFWREGRLDSDVLALLPGESEDPLLKLANQRIGETATRQVVVVLAGPSWSATRAAADAFLGRIAVEAPQLVPLTPDADAMARALDFYAPHRRGLLTPAQRTDLRDGDAGQRMDAALARLYGFGPSGGLGAWHDDPLGLWPAWWQARAGRGLQLRDGQLSVSSGGRDWVLLRFEHGVSAFQLDGERRLGQALDRAAAAARAAAGDGDLRLSRGGVPLHAEEAAVQASREVGTIGLGSLAAVVLLTWMAFHSLRPILLVSLSLLVGAGAGVAVTAMLFGEVHLLTLVFGASLIGVAEDYGIHYFASRQGQPGSTPRSLVRHLLPGLALALFTSVLGYLAIGVAPFPGLRQMAVFSATGLLAAFLTVVLWFPWLDRETPRASRFAARVAGSLASWPRWRAGPAAYALAGLLVVFIGTGLLRLEVSDDLRSLQSSSPSLLAQEQQIGRLLGLPSPAQFFLVSAADEQSLLEAEEALTDRLQSLQAAGELGGWRAVSDWVPSLRRQREDHALSLAAESPVRGRASELLGEPMPSIIAPRTPLLPDDALAQPIAEPARPLWLGRQAGRWGSVVMVEGLRPDGLAALAAAAEGLPRVRWVDRTASISRLLGHYREMMALLLLAGYVAVAGALWWRFRRHAWRALLPTALAALATLAALGWLGEPLQLFSVLAQLLFLGMGVDYGIFLLEHRDDPASWLAVSLGAASAWLAFGLLALSATPALHSFGLSLLIGLPLVWALSPCFRPASPAAVAHP